MNKTKALVWIIAVTVVVIGGLFVLGYDISSDTALVKSPTVNVSYSFTGDYREAAGHAQGDIVITPTQSNRSDGYYLVYYADNHGALTAYDELASIPITGDTVTYFVRKGTLLPYEATHILVYESDQPFLDEAPAAECAVASMTIPKEKRLRLKEATLSFGAVSDVHMNYEAYGYGAYEKWASALDFYSEQEMEYLIVAGDMTGDEEEEPLSAQYATYKEIIEQSSFPADRIYECIGNHGNTEVGRTQFVEYLCAQGEQHPYEGSPYYSVSVSNALFIFMAQELNAPGSSATTDCFSKEQIDWVEGLLKEYSGGEKTVFLIEHAPIYNYGAGDRERGKYTSTLQAKPQFPQTMRFKKLLQTYKDVIMISGHTHLTLYEGENYSNEDGKACHMIHLGSGSQPSYYEGDAFTRNHDGRYPATEHYGSEAHIVKVYENCVIFTGYNMSTGKIIPAATVIIPIEH